MDQPETVSQKSKPNPKLYAKRNNLAFSRSNHPWFGSSQVPVKIGLLGPMLELHCKIIFDKSNRISSLIYHHLIWRLFIGDEWRRSFHPSNPVDPRRSIKSAFAEPRCRLHMINSSWAKPNSKPFKANCSSSPQRHPKRQFLFFF